MNTPYKIASLLVAATLAVALVSCKRQELPVIAKVPEFTFTERSGEPFGRADMLGKVNIVEFIFTNCRAVCPTMAREMSRVYHAFPDDDQLQIVAVTVDPERDSLAVLRDYADKLGVNDDRWKFLRAPVDSVIKLSEEGFMLPANNLPMGHSAKFALVDPQGRIRGYYNGVDSREVDELIDEVRRMLKG